MYYALGSQMAAMRVLTSTGSTLYYLRSDHLGSTSVIMDATGTKIGEMRYKPYGEIRYTDGISPTNRQFTGQYADGNLNLVQMGARWYSPAVGRWLSPDTVVPDPTSPQSLNRFAYVRNSPLNRIDPTGHCDASADQKTDPCWIKLFGIENDWNVEIRNTDLWEIEYLEYLSQVLAEVGSMVGGANYLKEILGKSASRAGFDKFWIGAGGSCTTGCTYYGYMDFDLDYSFKPGRPDFGPKSVFYDQQPNIGKVTMGHELGHVIYMVIGDWSYAMVRQWENGVANDGGSQMVGDYHENLAQLVGIRAAGQGWQELDQATAALQIAPMDYAYIDSLSTLVPTVLNHQGGSWRSILAPFLAHLQIIQQLRHAP
jgi:RHS repeat-associated protein